MKCKAFDTYTGKGCVFARVDSRCAVEASVYCVVANTGWWAEGDDCHCDDERKARLLEQLGDADLALRAEVMRELIGFWCDHQHCSTCAMGAPICCAYPELPKEELLNEYLAARIAAKKEAAR